MGVVNMKSGIVFDQVVGAVLVHYRKRAGLNQHHAIDGINMEFPVYPGWRRVTIHSTWSSCLSCPTATEYLCLR